MSKTEIYVDADACPVKDEVIRVAERHGLMVHFVANSWMRLPAGPLVKRVVVDDGPDAADDWIAERAGIQDIVITQDIPLAARSLKAGALALGPAGKRFADDNIGMALAMRDLNAELRETGVIRGRNPAFTKADRSKFLQALEQALQDIKRGSRP
jgi:uncharacterized protein YaiI (UPF0178 family)